jgi:hypothetical protein
MGMAHLYKYAGKGYNGGNALPGENPMERI